MRRREFLAGSAATVGGLMLGMQSATANTSADWRSDNVAQKSLTHTYDEDFLKRYRPVFVAERQVVQRYMGLFGYRIQSPQYDYDYAYYWSQLTHQEGLPFVSADSKIGDHEPLICVVDKSSGELERVVWTNYHHYAGRADAENIQVVADETNIPTHPVFEIDPRWHNYYTSSSENWGRSPFPLRNWLAVRDRWIQNDFYEDTDAGAIEDPEVMDTAPAGDQREKWWADGTWDARAARIWALIGAGGINRAEHLDVNRWRL